MQLIPHTMFKKSLYIFGIALLIGTQFIYALTEIQTVNFFNGPTVSSIGDTSATFSLSNQVLASLTEEQKARVYFQYDEGGKKICPSIYTVPERCLPKKTPAGKTTVTVIGLTPGLPYTIIYVLDNTIRCSVAPCGDNSYNSLSVEFRTKGEGGPVITNPQVSTNLRYGDRENQVSVLQNLLTKQGYFFTPATGYFGIVTWRAVKNFQKANNLPVTGFVGPLTRAILNVPWMMNSATTVSGNARVMQTLPSSIKTGLSAGVVFDGVITAYSTQCFVDGECSITVDDKKIITTTGWSQQVVGAVRGVESISGIENKIGAKAKVYASKVEGNTYTLYGSSDYYIEVQ